MRNYFIKKPRTEIEPEEVLFKEKSKDYNIEPLTPGSVIKILTFLISILLMLVWFKSFDFQVVGFGKWQTLAETNRTRVVIKPAPRGIIYDRYNKPLVSNQEVLSLSVIPVELLGQNGLESDASRLSVQKLSQIIGIDEGVIVERISSRLKYSLVEPILIMQDVSPELAIQIELNKNQLVGIYLVQDFKREYLYPEVFSHVLGYLGYPTKTEIDKGDISPSDDVSLSGE